MHEETPRDHEHDTAEADMHTTEVCDRDPKIEKHASELDEVCVVTRSQVKRLTEKILTNADAGEDKVGEQVATNKKVEAVRVPLFPNWLDSWSLTEIRVMQREDETISKMKKLKTRRNDPPDKTTLFTEDNECKALCSQWNNLEIHVHDDVLYRKWFPEDPRDTTFLQIVVPKVLRKEILTLLYSHKTSGHPHIAKTLGKVRQCFHWVGHKADVVRWCKECKICERVNVNLNPKKAPLHHCNQSQFSVEWTA